MHKLKNNWNWQGSKNDPLEIEKLEAELAATFAELEEYGVTTDNKFDQNPEYWIAKARDAKEKFNKLHANRTDYASGDGNMYVPPPLWQLRSGTPPDEIVCNTGLELAIRPGGSPACVRAESVPGLVERGWTKIDNTGTWPNISTPAPETIAKNTEAEKPQNVENPADIAGANNQFALKFYSQVSQGNADSNIFFSP